MYVATVHSLEEGAFNSFYRTILIKHSNGKCIRDFQIFFSNHFSNVNIQNHLNAWRGVSSLVMCNFARSNREIPLSFVQMCICA